MKTCHFCHKTLSDSEVFPVLYYDNRGDLCSGEACSPCFQEHVGGAIPSFIAPEGSPDDPAHYKLLNQQPIEIMQRLLTHEQFVGLLWGNCIKYALRLRAKDQPADDAKKLSRYAGWLAQALEEKEITL